jgi:parallel beta-helix repeat protein
VFGPKGTVISDCDFAGPGFAVYNGGATGTTFGTRLENCRIKGWGVCAVFLNGGEQIINCSIVQDDMNLWGHRSSHGLYIHSGCKDVLVQDTLIQNARYYGAQIWGKDEGTTSTNIRFERVTFKNCMAGLTVQQISPTSARAGNIVVKDCQFLGTYSSPALGIKQGDGVQVTGNLFDGSAGAGIQLGVWASYEPGFSISNATISGNVVRNCDKGIWAQASNGGTFNNVTVSGNTVTNCNTPIDLREAPGVTFIP